MLASDFATFVGNVSFNVIRFVVFILDISLC